MRLAARLVAFAVAALLVGAAPAAADPAKPTDYRSVIDSIEPPLPDGVEVSIIGGDSFLRVTAEPGHTVVVMDYEGQPYLQILEDGTVQENQQSKATYQNVDRYGQIDESVLEGLDPEGEPEWRTIGDDGEHAWHDHRIHWMSPERRPGIQPGDVVQTNEVPMVVDGVPTTVTVSVLLEEPESALPWIVVVIVVGGGLVAAGWRRRSLGLAVGAAGVASVLAVVTGNGQLAASPAGTGTSSLVLIVPAVALAAAVLAAVLLWRKKEAGAGIALLASAAALAGWALLRLAVLWKPVLPTDLPADLDRAATAVAVGAAVGIAVLTLRSGAVTPAPLTDDE